MSTTEKLLHLLAQSNDYVSGQELANQLNVSRTAIWKAIKNLQDAGYTIVSKQKKGYRLSDNNKLNAALIKKYLAPTLTDIDFEVYQSLTSTNIYAKNQANNLVLKRPLVILAQQQTAGYGRHGRTFCSPQTGIYLSLVLNNPNPKFTPGLITTAAAVALVQTIEKKLQLSAQIKWVNDILIAQKKVCGILTEGIVDLENRSLKQIVLGCGINYLTDLNELPPEIQQRSGSLKEAALATKVSSNEFVATFLNEFFEIYRNYPTVNFMDNYRQHCCLINQIVTLSQATKEFKGVVVDINDQGELVLDNGQTFNSGEVIKVRPLY